MVARIGSIFAPYIAELKPEAISEWTFVVVCVIALLASINIIDPRRNA